MQARKGYRYAQFHVCTQACVDKGGMNKTVENWYRGRTWSALFSEFQKDKCLAPLQYKMHSYNLSSHASFPRSNLQKTQKQCSLKIQLFAPKVTLLHPGNIQSLFLIRYLNLTSFLSYIFFLTLLPPKQKLYSIIIHNSQKKDF